MVIHLALAVSVLALSSCADDPSRGYAFGGGFRSEVRSVSVPVWVNRTFTPDLGARLTEAIIKELQRSTGWRVTNHGAGATLTGVISSANLRKLGTDPNTGLVQELAVDLAVDFDLRSNSTQKAIITRRNFRASGVFIPKQGINEPIEIGQQGAIETLARDIVNELRSDW